ncbi:alpha- and gamma-adaptin-binding protein p34-like [Lineus longissimus]|uniref:alpha- and gamma-adaptin-binding protein p34-like n=1 Tax=Lineus longissimus TaxID=88925 RepID=UPI002B4EFB9D
MSAPCALLASCTNLDPKVLVKGILDTEDLPDPENVLEDISSYAWHIDTKYYTADVSICTTQKKTIGDAEFASNVQAIILHFDSKEASSFAMVNSWLPFASEIEPEIQILLCDCCRYEDVVAKSKVHDWCLKHNFELVEMKPDEDSDSEEDDFREPRGMERVIKALHAHMWPNLVMKDPRSAPFRSPFMQQMIAAEATGSKLPDLGLGEHNDDIETETNLGCHNDDIADRLKPKQETDECDEDSISPVGCHAAATGGGNALGSNKTAALKEDASNNIDSLLGDDMALFSALGNEDPSSESFEELFTKMKVMKDKAETLPPDERKAYAEKVAISFWKAIGGNEDEIGGLSDSD